ncbi:MAG: outer membrane protein transport protein [Limisphaerales bacterium]
MTGPGFSNLGSFAAGKPAFLFPPNLNLGLTVPQSVMLGIYQELSAKWAVMADVGWQQWSQFGKADVSVGPGALGGITTQLNYQDTWHGAIGAEYRLSEDWLLTGGFAYDTSAVSDASRTVTLPMARLTVSALARSIIGARPWISERL